MVLRILILMTVMVFSSIATAEPCLIVGTTDRSVMENPVKVFLKVMADADICVEVIRLPTARLDQDFASGK